MLINSKKDLRGKRAHRVKWYMNQWFKRHKIEFSFYTDDDHPRHTHFWAIRRVPPLTEEEEAKVRRFLAYAIEEAVDDFPND